MSFHQNRHRLLPTYRKWVNGNVGGETLQELLETEDVPPENYGALLRQVSMHPVILDMSYSEAREAPDREITHLWGRYGSPDGWDDARGELLEDVE